MTIIEAEPGWFVVKLRAVTVGDFASRTAAERYIRSRGYFVL